MKNKQTLLFIIVNTFNLFILIFSIIMSSLYPIFCEVNWFWPALSLIGSVFFLCLKKRRIFALTCLPMLIQSFFFAFYPNFKKATNHYLINIYYVSMRFVIPILIVIFVIISILLLLKEGIGTIDKRNMRYLIPLSSIVFLISLTDLITFIINEQFDTFDTQSYINCSIKIVLLFYSIVPILYNKWWIFFILITPPAVSSLIMMRWGIFAFPYIDFVGFCKSFLVPLSYISVFFFNSFFNNKIGQTKKTNLNKI